MKNLHKYLASALPHAAVVCLSSFYYYEAWWKMIIVVQIEYLNY